MTWNTDCHASWRRADPGRRPDCLGRGTPGHLHWRRDLDERAVEPAELCRLAAEVASILQSPLSPEGDEWNDQLDTFMDVMDEDDGVDVHRLVQGIVTKEGSTRNANHDALARNGRLQRRGRTVPDASDDEHVGPVLGWPLSRPEVEAACRESRRLEVAARGGSSTEHRSFVDRRPMGLVCATTMCHSAARRRLR